MKTDPSLHQDWTDGLCSVKIEYCGHSILSYQDRSLHRTFFLVNTPHPYIDLALLLLHLSFVIIYHLSLWKSVIKEDDNDVLEEDEKMGLLFYDYILLSFIELPTFGVLFLTHF